MEAREFVSYKNKQAERVSENQTSFHLNCRLCNTKTGIYKKYLHSKNTDRSCFNLFDINTIMQKKKQSFIYAWNSTQDYFICTAKFLQYTCKSRPEMINYWKTRAFNVCALISISSYAFFCDAWSVYCQ